MLPVLRGQFLKERLFLDESGRTFVTLGDFTPRLRKMCYIQISPLITDRRVIVMRIVYSL